MLYSSTSLCSKGFPKYSMGKWCGILIRWYFLIRVIQCLQKVVHNFPKADRDRIWIRIQVSWFPLFHLNYRYYFFPNSLCKNWCDNLMPTLVRICSEYTQVAELIKHDFRWNYVRSYLIFPFWLQYPQISQHLLSLLHYQSLTTLAPLQHPLGNGTANAIRGSEISICS